MQVNGRNLSAEEILAVALGQESAPANRRAEVPAQEYIVEARGRHFSVLRRGEFCRGFWSHAEALLYAVAMNAADKNENLPAEPQGRGGLSDSQRPCVSAGESTGGKR